MVFIIQRHVVLQKQPHSLLMPSSSSPVQSSSVYLERRRERSQVATHLG